VPHPDGRQRHVVPDRPKFLMDGRGRVVGRKERGRKGMEFKSLEDENVVAQGEVACKSRGRTQGNQVPRMGHRNRKEEHHEPGM